jgi:small subunit ribosomal protein S6
VNSYEITLIIRPDRDDEQTRAAMDGVVRRIQTAGGEIIASYPWSPARRRMAYEIRDFGDGYYFTATFRIDPTALRDLENALRLNDNVLRFLIVQASDQAIRQSQQRMHQAATPAAPPSAPPPAPTPQQTQAVESVLEAQEIGALPAEEAAEHPVAAPEPAVTGITPAPSEAEE